MASLSPFFDGLDQVFIEQTSPLEMIIFIFVVVIACMTLAALFYIAVMTFIWAVSLRPQEVSLRRVFLPSAGQFRENAAEYLIGMFTSLLLAMTTIVKHDLVQQIRAWPAEQLPGLANLFPLHTVPDAVTSVVGEATVESFLKPALDAGETDRVSVVLEGLIKQGISLPSGRAILFACGIMVIVHLLWLASRRYALLSKSPATDGRLGYDKTARSLLVLSVCVALLLVAPSMLSDPARLARSSIASLQHVDPAEVPHYATVLQAIERQRQDLRILKDASEQVFDPDAGVQQSVWSTIANRLDDHDESVGELTGRLDDYGRSVDELDDRVGGAAADLDGIQSRLTDLEARLAAALDRLAAAQRAVDGLPARFATLDSAIAEMAARVDRFDIRLAGVEGRVAVNEQQLAELFDALQELRSVIAGFDARLASYDERLAELAGQIERLAGMHTETGLLAVSGPPGLEFQVRETGDSGVVPSVLELPPGRYTLAARVQAADARTANLQQTPAVVVQAVVRPDRTTGVTLSGAGR